MPEIPELEAMRANLNRRVAGHAVARAQVRILTSNRLLTTDRRGKYLLLRFAFGHLLAVHLMLTGRLQLGDPGSKMPKRTAWLLAFADGYELRYFDEKLDGKAYLVAEAELPLIPRWLEMGPDVLDPALTADLFNQRLRRYPGQIKRALVNEAFVAGIGNAYADEILFEIPLPPQPPARPGAGTRPPHRHPHRLRLGRPHRRRPHGRHH